MPSSRGSLAADSREPRQILVVLPQLPYPLHASGLALRYLPVLEALVRRHVVDLIVVTAEEGGSRCCAIEALRSRCRRVSVICRRAHPRPGVWKRLATRLAVLAPWTPPDHCTFHDVGLITRRISSFVAGIRYDCLLLAGDSTALLACTSGVSSRRTVVDFVDSPTLSMQRAVHGKRSMLGRYEGWKVARWERSVRRVVDATLYVSPVDARFVACDRRTVRPPSVVPNGVSVEGYHSAKDQSVRSPSIGFLGNMSYVPNAEAVLWLYERVFVPLRHVFPSLSLFIIGRDPGPAICRLTHDQGVTVTGAVVDHWRYVNAVDVFAFPLLRGAGLKNKVLEVMYAGRPVVTTHIGAEGTGAVDGRHLVVIPADDRFRVAVSRLLASASECRRLGAAGRSFVAHHFAWPRILPDFERVLFGNPIVSDGTSSGPEDV